MAYITKSVAQDISSLVLSVKVNARKAEEASSGSDHYRYSEEYFDYSTRADAAQWAINILLGIDVEHSTAMLEQRRAYNSHVEQLVQGYLGWAELATEQAGEGS